MRDILGEMDDKSLQERNPMRDVQKQTSLPKRFYKEVSVGQDAGNFTILLDGKSVKTPAKKMLSVSSEVIAIAAAKEWAAQEELIDPAKMPITRMTNSAIDGVVDNSDAVMEEIISFSGTDLLFYRAEAPNELVALQAEHWDPIIDWAASSFGAQYILTEGIMHKEQPSEAINAYADVLRRYSDPFALTGLHSATTLTGSALLALTIAEGCLTPQEAWAAAHVDEDWNISQWGTDDDAEKRRVYRWADMQAACLLINASK